MLKVASIYDVDPGFPVSQGVSFSQKLNVWEKKLKVV